MDSSFRDTDSITITSDILYCAFHGRFVVLFLIGLLHRCWRLPCGATVMCVRSRSGVRCVCGGGVVMSLTILTNWCGVFTI